MPRAVYSTRFLAFSTTSTEEQSYAVPSGFVAVIRGVASYLGEEADGDVQVYDGASGAVVSDVKSSAGATTAGNWSGHQVFPSGESIVASITTTAYASVIVSGYLLAL